MKPFGGLALLLIGLSTVSPQPPAPARRALLIGINDYALQRPLKGCLNDVERMRTLLTGKFDFPTANITVLRNGQATRDAILKALDTLVADTAADDVVVVHYSGHGSRIRDASGDEADGWDETLVPFDSRQAGIFDITDDEINGRIEKLTNRTPNVTVVFDSCHSGSATRGGLDTRRVPDDLRPAPSSSGPAARTAEGVNDLRPANANYVLISGSRAHELSNEMDFDGQRYGALSFHLTEALERLAPGATYRDLMDIVKNQVTDQFSSQHPEIEGASDRVVFGVARAAADTYLLARPDAGNVRIAGGVVHGLAAGTELDVYPPGARDFGPTAKPAARVRVSAVEALTSTADITTGGPVSDGSRAVVRLRSYPDSKLRVYIRASDAFAASLRQELVAYPSIEVVADEARADLRFREENGLIYTQRGDVVTLAKPLPVNGADTVRKLGTNAAAWSRWYALSRLQNESTTLPITITIADGTRTSFTSGDTVEIGIENVSSRSLFAIALDLDPDGGVTVLYPAGNQTNDAIAPSGVRTFKMRVSVPNGPSDPPRRSVRDIIKVLAATEPIDPAWFRQAAPRAAEARQPAGGSLSRFLGQTALGLSRHGTPVIVDDWSTESRHIETTLAAAPGQVPAAGGGEGLRLDSFIAHFPADTRADLVATASRAVTECPTAAAQPETCWQISSMGPGRSEVELRPGGRSDGSRAALSLGTAWDQADALRRQLGAELVEPNFEVSLDQSPEQATRSGSGTPDKPAAAKDAEWSLKHVNVAAALQILRDRGAAAGSEAGGIIIGHPDTGYREHPEIWSQDEAKSPIMYRSGWDFVENTDRPFDPLVDAGMAPNPGHGTKSSSVIISPPGKQWRGGGPADLVTGVAPGARAVPLRVNTSVVNINTGRMAKAINFAVAPDSQTVRLKAPVDVISISMGGLPSFALYKAVRSAESTGVLLVAAAGNHVKLVVWPARFRRSIAVAATNVECGTWPGSSNGDAVDISAPGESVWKADVATDGSEGISMGQGTTYATATTAGVAALWVARYRNDPLFQRLKKEGRLTDAFRALLQKTAWVPGSTSPPPPGVTCAAGATWNSNRFGNGIVNAGRLLAEPIAEPPASRAATEPEPEFPVFGSLFPAGVSADDVSARFRRLLPAASASDSRALELELATVYALDAAAQQALDPILSSTPPSDAAFASARRALRGLDISQQLAKAIGQ